MDTRPFHRYLTPEEEKSLLSSIARRNELESKRDLAWIKLMRQTGIRVGAMSRLTVGDAREALRTHRLVLRPEIQKRQRGHEVHLTGKASGALRALLKIGDSMHKRWVQGREENEFPYLRASGKDLDTSRDLTAPLVLSRHHRNMSVRSFEARFRYWCTEAGITVPATPHWLRHTCAKRLIERSTSRNPLGIVQLVLGHATIASTGIYTQPDREQVAAAMEEAA